MSLLKSVFPKIRAKTSGLLPKNRPLIGIPDRSANLDLMQKLPLLQLSLFSVKMHLPSGDVIYMLFVIVLHCFCR